jgi:hypothetical protein
VGLSLTSGEECEGFHVAPEGLAIAGRRILLVDDVLTTGPRPAVEEGGAAHVDVLTFALVLEPSGLILADGKTMTNITIYQACGYCYSAKSFDEKGIVFEEIDVSGVPRGSAS